MKFILINCILITFFKLCNSNNKTEVPARIENLKLNTLNSTAIQLKWKSSGNKSATSYLIMFSPLADMGHTQKIKLNTTKYIVTGLEQESEYIFKVYAINEGGNSAETMATAKTFSDITELSEVYKVVEISRTSTSIQVTWSDDNKLNSDPVYDIEYHILFEDEQRGPTKSKKTSKKKVWLKKLSPATQYRIRVRVRYLDLVSGWSMTLDSTTREDKPYDPPADLSVSPVGSNNVMISWQPPHRPNGVIVGYTIYYTTDRVDKKSGGYNNVNWIEESQIAGNILNHVLKDISSDTGYHFQISARTRKGSGPRSERNVYVMMPKAVVVTNNGGPSVAGGQATASILDDVRIWIIGGVAVILVFFAFTLLVACLCLRRRSHHNNSRAKQDVSYATTTIVKNEAPEQISPPDLWMELNARGNGTNNDAEERLPLKHHEDTHYMHSPKPVLISMDQRTESLYTPDSSMLSDNEGSLLRRGGVYPRTQLNKQYTSTPRVNVADINGHIDPDDVRSLPRSSHPLKSFTVPAPPDGPPKHIVKPIPQITPYKSPSIMKPFSMTDDLLHKSASNEELTAEMMNLEGLMQDLSQITEQQFKV